MPPRSAGEITQLLTALRGGDETANAALAELVYDELRRIARNRLRGGRSHLTLQPTELVHEAYLKIVNAPHKLWNGRTHFFASAAQVMHRILIDRSRAARSQKRGGVQARIPLHEAIPDRTMVRDHILAIEQALERLEQLDARQCRVVRMRAYDGMTELEVARALGMSERTVKRDWNMALAYLQSEMLRSLPR